jgi:predicted nucleotidyltransferase
MGEGESVDILADVRSAAKEAVDKFKSDHSHEILFANVSGAHLFGTATVKSDIDLRGCFIVPTAELLRFKKPKDTIELSKGDVEIQFHEVEKFLSLMTRGNMNFIEEVKSPLRIVDTPIAEEMRKLADLSLSKETFSHVQGMSIHTKKHAMKENFSNPKRNLYLLRELLRGIALFRDGIFQSDVIELAETYGESSVVKLTNRLVQLKREGRDYGQTMDFRKAIGHLENEMLREKEFGTLRARPSDDVVTRAEKMLVRLRLERIDPPRKL